MTPWSLAGRISPRRRIRVAAADDAGRALNSYPDTAPVSGPAPDRPYAVHLTDNRGRYTLLGFDLDTRHGPVTADLARLHALLDRARLPHVTCASGPGGGRHVWVALAEPVTAVVVAGIAHGLARMLPSLDTAPLLNTRTGALRPPGAPHRSGGTSQVIAGDIRTLLHPTAGTSQVLTLAGLITHDQAIGAAADTAAPSIGTDEHGHPYLPGERRPLPARSQAALTTPIPPGTDASAVLAAVLCGAARAHWRLADITALLPTAPGLEHARTEHTNTGRIPRPPAEQRRILAHHWRRCLTHVAAAHGATAAAADDPTFEPRCATTAAAVAHTQRRADASPGRWAQPGGPADRRVLDVLCELVLAAVTCDIELDIRRLSHLTGIGRDTARVALHRLAGDGWITRTQAAQSIHAAHWALNTPPAPLSTPTITNGRSQAATRPPAPSQLRAAWRSHLRERTSTIAHDVFTPAGLGHHTARVYQTLATTATSSTDLATALGYPPDRTRHYLEQLAASGLAQHRTAGWSRPPTDRRDSTARNTLGCAGILAARQRRHHIERQAWPMVARRTRLAPSIPRPATPHPRPRSTGASPPRSPFLPPPPRRPPHPTQRPR